MNWQVPAKTFLVGEYVAVTGDSAIVLTTSPCFNITVTEDRRHEGIHEASPAGRWWAKQKEAIEQGLAFQDPYQGQGGLGASSAQFLGAFLAYCHKTETNPSLASLLEAYHDVAWNGQGLRPSAYDLIAQSQRQCVYINRKQETLSTYDWDSAFPELAFVLVHSGTKMATHHHLQEASLPKNLQTLSSIVEETKMAFEEGDGERVILAVNTYQRELQAAGLTLESSLQKMEGLKKNANILAIKGCGAMGADVLLLIVLKKELEEQIDLLKKQGHKLLATSTNLHNSKPLFNRTGDITGMNHIKKT